MPQGITKAHCNKCHHSTSHDIISLDNWECHYEAENGTDPYDYKLSEMLKCRGCETVSLRITSKAADDERATVVYYPPAIARRMPDWAEVRFRSTLAYSLHLLDVDDEPYVPEDLWHLMREVYVAVRMTHEGLQQWVSEPHLRA